MRWARVLIPLPLFSSVAKTDEFWPKCPVAWSKYSRGTQHCGPSIQGMVILAGAKPKTSWHPFQAHTLNHPLTMARPSSSPLQPGSGLTSQYGTTSSPLPRGILIDKSIQALLIWKVNVSEEFHRDPYPWSMVMQMEDKRLYDDTRYSDLRPSRHV